MGKVVEPHEGTATPSVRCPCVETNRPARGRDPDGVMRGRLIDAARALVEAGGPEALSMRKVAAEVGVAATAIYWHVGSRDDLLNAVLDAMLADLPPLVATGRTPQRRVSSVVHSLRTQILATTPTQQLARQLGRSAEVFLPAQVSLARELSAAGLRGTDGAEAVRAILFLVGGFVLLEDEHRSRQPGSRTSQDLWKGVRDDRIDGGLLRAMSEPATPDTLFGYAVERLLASILG
jgi:TetR/AcrR family transcriptional regulator, tetracycline repressor protein